MNTFYLIGLAVAGIVLLKKKPGNTVITMDPIDVKPLPYSPAKKSVTNTVTIVDPAYNMPIPEIGYIPPGIPSGTYYNRWNQNSSNAFFDSKLQGLNEYTE